MNAPPFSRTHGEDELTVYDTVNFFLFGKNSLACGEQACPIFWCFCLCPLKQNKSVIQINFSTHCGVCFVVSDVIVSGLHKPTERKITWSLMELSPEERRLREVKPGSRGIGEVVRAGDQAGICLPSSPSSLPGPCCLLRACPCFLAWGGGGRIRLMFRRKRKWQVERKMGAMESLRPVLY